MRVLKILTLIFLISALVSCHTGNKKSSPVLESGVSKKLNDIRAKNISKVVYKLHFVISSDEQKPMIGEMEMAFDIKDNKQDVILDFQQPAKSFRKLLIDGKEYKNFKIENGHIIIPGGAFKNRRNIIGMEFVPGEMALARGKNCVYSVFAPGKASMFFPCFDQPGIKGQFILALDVPEDWIAVSNGPVKSTKEINGKKRYVFEQTKPLSTYLFSFAAGKFTSIQKKLEGHQLTFYYLENDEEKIKNNIDDIMLLQADALTWMEQYTGMVYPFRKFGFVAIPSLSYDGMENPGNIFYNAGRLFLDKDAPVEQKYRRAHLIANQTAHIWFGDLVTMKWVDDAWMKEALSDFIAGKMTNPTFPSINHRLRFITGNFPVCYDIDRTAGAVPIEQHINNIKDVPLLYNDISYHKPQILLHKLEKILGVDTLANALVEYLRKYSYLNASWDDLIGVLNAKTGKDLVRWSNAWVKEGGMPLYKTTLVFDEMNIDQFDMQNKMRIWPQYLTLFYVDNGKYRDDEFYDDKEQYIYPMRNEPDILFLNEKGTAYGYQVFKENHVVFISGKNIFKMDPVTRAALYINLWEDMLNYNTWPEDLRSIFPYYIKTENQKANIKLLLGYYKKLFWRYSLPGERDSIAPVMEKLLWTKANQTDDEVLKREFFETYLNTAITPQSIKKLVDIWNEKTSVKGLKLKGDDYTEIACELAVRKETPAGKFIPDNILKQQLERINGKQKKNDFAFLMSALNKNPGVRAEFFETLKLPASRENMPLVLKALHYLNHPLVALHSESFILPAMEMLEEIKEINGMVYVKTWLDETFYGHNSKQVAKLIDEYLNKKHDLDAVLRTEILQASDPVLRASKILSPEN